MSEVVPPIPETPLADAAKSLTEWADGMAEWVPAALDMRNAMFSSLRAFVEACRG